MSAIVRTPGERPHAGDAALAIRQDPVEIAVDEIEVDAALVGPSSIIDRSLDADFDVADFVGTGTHELPALRRELQLAANRHLLILREAAGLQELQATVSDIRARVLSDSRIETPQDRVHAIEIVNMCQVADIMAQAALLRVESRGSHYRVDIPEKDPAQETNMIFDKHVDDGAFRASLAQLN